MEKYDTCKTGSSAKLAALNRNVLAECAIWCKKHVGAIFHDFAKFFDSFDIEIIVKEANFTKHSNKHL